MYVSVPDYEQGKYLKGIGTNHERSFQKSQDKFNSKRSDADSLNLDKPNITLNNKQ